MIFIFHADGTSEAHLQLELQHSMRLFRAQRNFYISGFSIFLTLVIRRLVILISAQAQLLAQSEASLRQAQSASTAARSLLSQQKTNEIKDDKVKDDGKNDELVCRREECFEFFFFHQLFLTLNLLIEFLLALKMGFVVVVCITIFQSCFSFFCQFQIAVKHKTANIHVCFTHFFFTVL